MDNQDDLVSVIVPCFNAGKTIRRTLECLKTQSYRNIEIIIVNDGSKDDSENIVEDFMNSNKLDIKYFKQENRGVSVARNRGIEVAKGEYIFFLDADDVYHYDLINSMVNTIKKYNLDTVYCLHSRNVDEVINDKDSINIQGLNIYNQNQIMEDFLFNKGKISFASFIYKTSIIKNYNIRFTVGRKTAEDIEFTWKYLTMCKKGVFLDRKLYGYNNTENSAVNTVYWERTDSLKSIIAIEEFMEIHRCEFSEIFKGYMYSRAIWSYSKTFAKGKRRDLFYRLHKEFDVKRHMKNIQYKSKDYRVVVTALLYRIHPELFYIVVSNT